MAGAGSAQEQGVLDLQRDPCLWESNPSTASQAGAGAWSEGARMELLSLRVGGVPGAGSAEGAVITFRSGRGSAVALADLSPCCSWGSRAVTLSQSHRDPGCSPCKGTAEQRRKGKR